MNYRIEFGELRVGEIARNHINDTLNKNWISMGEKVSLFESGWKSIFNCSHALAVSSGTDAGINALLSLYSVYDGIKRGDEVIVPALSFIATSHAVLAAGFTPIFVDIEADTLNINPDLIEEKITSKTRAIKAVDTMGKPCNYEKLRKICDKYNLLLINDGCESPGARYNGRLVYQYCDVATCSFYVAHLICCGEGGIVYTNRDDIAASVKSTRSHGRRNGDLYFDFPNFGLNSKMNDMEASVGLEGLSHFHETFAVRSKHLHNLIDLTKDLSEFAWFNKVEPLETLCPHGFSITLKDEKLNCLKLSEFLDKNGIKVKRNFGCIPTQHGSFSWMGHKLGDFPVSEYVGNNGIHIGCHQYLTDEDIKYVSDVIHQYFLTC